MTAAARYNAIRRRLRLTQAEVAEATGYSLGYVSKWGHAGQTAKDPPDAAVDRLAQLLRERGAKDLELLEGEAA
ncbi:helix-turn-helix transcriptional regulator [Aureimonas sp. SK2]|uniref:helix-turn-helix transcriptional regulator n=1 Tax=Aureimonas sp. SK2 TaxID=3015992 RepID=UPI00244432E5|nr:helix-turn-helix transcriptional regulator [Aureimonas sp. SK2]